MDGKPSRTGAWRIALRLGLGGTGLALFCKLAAGLIAQPHPQSETGAPPDPLTALGLTVTQGAAPGSIEDRACALCHHEIYSAYQEVGMARSFMRPGPQRVIEDFEHNEFFHPSSQQHYEMLQRDGRYRLRRYQLDADGNPINVLEQPVDWILGSGDHARTYLYQTPAGELYQLPIAWYSQTKSWGMAPGFDRKDHEGITRRVRRECMFCHNAYPNVAPASDGYEAPQVFPPDLPQGTGCQRCHGPGAEHALRAFGKSAGRPQDAIVNPARLSPERRDDICFQCHLQPSVALPGLRRFGRGDYSFQPGESALSSGSIGPAQSGRRLVPSWVMHMPSWGSWSKRWRATGGLSRSTPTGAGC
jgi:hypothetical protein